MEQRGSRSAGIDDVHAGTRQRSSWGTKRVRICQLIALQRSHGALQVGALKR